MIKIKPHKNTETTQFKYLDVGQWFIPITVYKKNTCIKLSCESWYNVQDQVTFDAPTVASVENIFVEPKYYIAEEVTKSEWEAL